MNDVRADIAIVGAGLVGASLALLIASERPDWQITLLDRRDPRASGDPASDDFDARTTALVRGSLPLLRRLGLWPALEQQATAIRRIHVSDRGHPGGSLLDDGQPLGQVVTNARLGAALHAALAARDNVELRAPASVQGLQPGRERATLSLADGGEVSARLVIAADGERSPLRRAAGIEASVTDYGQTALIANVAFDEPHMGVAYERFTRRGPLALLPLDGASGRRAALIWTLPAATAEALLECDEAGFLAALQDTFGWRQGRFKRLGRRDAYPLRLVVAREQVRSRLALMGNAAHLLHPVAGQGFNLALRDAACLGRVLAGAEDPGVLPGLQRYAHQRAADQSVTIGFSDQLIRLFGDARPGRTLPRQLGFLALRGLPGARGALAAQAMGQSPLGQSPLNHSPLSHSPSSHWSPKEVPR